MLIQLYFTPPGTRFMLDVTTSIVYYACARLATNKWGHLRFEVSDATVKARLGLMGSRS
jgi:hypothetical protein